MKILNEHDTHDVQSLTSMYRFQHCLYHQIHQRYQFQNLERPHYWGRSLCKITSIIFIKIRSQILKSSFSKMKVTCFLNTYSVVNRIQRMVQWNKGIVIGCPRNFWPNKGWQGRMSDLRVKRDIKFFAFKFFNW